MKTKRDGWTWRRSLAGLVVIALMPKCIACVAAYLAAGAGATAVAREWCGGEAEGGAAIAWLPGWIVVAGAAWLAGRGLWRRGGAKTRANEAVDAAGR